MAKKKTNITLPSGLSDKATIFINAVIENLKNGDRLDRIDTASLYILAQSFESYLKAQEILAVEGLTVTSNQGNQSLHPCWKVAKDSEKTILSILTEYGATLKSRQKLKAVDELVEDSPLVQFLNASKD